MKNLIRLLINFACAFAVLAALQFLAHTFSVPYGDTTEIPVDYEHVGSEPEYQHGAHCIDGRTF